MANFGPLVLNDNLSSIAKASELCNRYGMDTITCGSEALERTGLAEPTVLSALGIN